MFSLFPGKKQTNILVPLQKGLKWQGKEREQPLEFRLSKHTVRFALKLIDHSVINAPIRDDDYNHHRGGTLRFHTNSIDAGSKKQ